MQPTHDRLIRTREVMNRTGLSRTTLYRLIERGQFPAPRALAEKAVAYLESEVNEWIANRPRSSGLGKCATNRWAKPKPAAAGGPRAQPAPQGETPAAA